RLPERRSRQARPANGERTVEVPLSAKRGGCGWGPWNRGRLREAVRMRLILERRDDRPAWLTLASPLAAVALTLVAGAALVALLGKDALAALKVFFLDPLSDGWALQELAVKATPLSLVSVGLTLCYRSNNWNVGAEG